VLLSVVEVGPNAAEFRSPNELSDTVLGTQVLVLLAITLFCGLLSWESQS